MPKHAAPLFEIPEDMPIRQVLYLSQTNVTPDPEAGLHYAATAYERALDPAIVEEDPTAAGEAAAKAGFRAIQADQPYRSSMAWFERSRAALPDDEPRSRRERIATYLLEGRAAALHYVQHKTTFTYEYSSVADYARNAFRNAEERLEDRRDPYAPMLYGHWATFEAMNDGNNKVSPFPIAWKGLKSAILARTENANTSKQQLTAKERILKNGAFVLKQSRRSILAMALGATRPIANLEKVHKLRRTAALKSLG